MNAERIRELEEVLLITIMIELTVLILIVFVVPKIWQTMYPTGEVIYYFQNCNNLTLFPDGCQVLT